MTVQEAIDYIENSGWSSTRLGLERTTELLRRLGNPQKNLKFIHVAGSNGKGSTCAMLDSILRAAGYRVGLYTSPHIEEFGERIRINGENIPDNALASITEKVRVIADAMEDHPSQFEIVTAIAMLYFSREKCEIVVLEVGLGGSLDSTNVIDAPELAVITNIGLEHTEYLGNTLQEIAVAKGGIIKSGSECICYGSTREVIETIKHICDSKNVRCTVVDVDEARSISQSLNSQKFFWRGTEYELPLLGNYQLHNAAVVLSCVSALRDKGWKISAENVTEGLRTVWWPARMEVLSQSPLFILDGGHNPQCAQALADSLKLILADRKAIFLVGVLADKDYARVMEQIIPFAAKFICVTPQSPRALSAADLEIFLRSKGCDTECCADTSAGIAAALDAAGEEGNIIAVGSLYMAGGVRAQFRDVYRKWLRKRKITYRNSLTAQEIKDFSGRIVSNLIQLPEYRNAKNILLYQAVRSEVSLQALQDESKCFAYPLCISKTEMKALVPENEEAWHTGYCGISEPAREKSREIQPDQLDLVVCPCTAFDEDGSRMGMGGGFYDRYLPQCTNACIIAVAYEGQKAAKLPAEPWDMPMDIIVTEEKVYYRDSKK